MKLLIPFVFAAVLVAAITACSDTEDEPQPTPTQPAATATQTTAPAPTATTQPEPSPTSPTPSAPTPSPPGGSTVTGDRDLDAIIEAALEGDAPALAGYIQLTTTACTTVQGLGGPPKCFNAPGSPPDGTDVEAFPISSCELGWAYDVQPLARDLVERDLELFAVLELDLPGPLFNEPSMPELDHAIIFESQAPGIGRLGHLVGVDDGAVVYFENLCGGAPETYLTDRQQIADNHEIILRGPAFP